MSTTRWSTIGITILCLASIGVARQVNGQGRGRGAALTLPDGPGKLILLNTCTLCHDLGRVANSGGFTKQGWDELIGTMVSLPAAQRSETSDYLAKSFPELPRPKPVVLPGDVKVNIREWNAPSLGSRPHDPEPGPDGSIWWTGMFANVIGRVNPKTDEIKEFPLKTPGSGPHGLELDRDGNVWFTANQAGYVGTLDPKTGAVVEHKMPEGVRDPHTPLFAANGMLFFTAQGANTVGRIDPKTGEIKVQKTPTERANPYGMVFTTKGVPFVCDFGTNKIIEINPDTLAIKEYPLPNEDSRPRRIAISPDDIIWYADYSRGYLGRLDPKTGQVTEWPSPSGPKSQPYGITYQGGAIWYVESAIKPNVLVRFDIRTSKFQSWIIPGGGGVVRNIKTTDDGRNIVMAESGVNKIALVEIGASVGSR
jgi:virginiamycin B lyase